MSKTPVTPAANRRNSRRLPPRKTVKTECRKGTLGLGVNLAEACRDLSEGGVCLILKAPVDPNLEVEVLINGHGVRAIKRAGRVCWTHSLDDGRVLVGVQFQGLVPFADVQNLARP
jgi:hypothetical protein